MASTSFVSAQAVTVKVTRQGGRTRKDGKSTNPVVRLMVPRDIASRLGDRIDGMSFDVELNDEGILFRASSNGHHPVALPAWVPTKK